MKKLTTKLCIEYFDSLWYTKEGVNFVELTDGIYLVKFYLVEDRERILNMAPWLFYQNLFSMVPFVENKDFCEYNFGLGPFWVRIYNIRSEKNKYTGGNGGGRCGGESLSNRLEGQG